MKIAIITANLGGIDPIYGIPKQTVDVDFRYYTDASLPYPLPNLNKRLQSKYLKLQTHRFLPGYDAYIWIDGRVLIESNNCVELLQEELKENDVAIFRHLERSNVFDEMDFIVDMMNKGNHYLLSRYGNQQMEMETEFYQTERLPKDFPLYATYVFARINNEKVNTAFDEWWRRTIEYSHFDQAMFSYVAWKHELKIKELSWQDYRKVIHVTKHMI